MVDGLYGGGPWPSVSLSLSFAVSLWFRNSLDQKKKQTNKQKELVPASGFPGRRKHCPHHWAKVRPAPAPNKERSKKKKPADLAVYRCRISMKRNEDSPIGFVVFLFASPSIKKKKVGHGINKVVKIRLKSSLIGNLTQKKNVRKQPDVMESIDTDHFNVVVVVVVSLFFF